MHSIHRFPEGKAMDEEETPGPALATSIFLVPHVFGWLVFLPGYNLITRMVVIIYMVMTAVPLYLLVDAIWNSGEGSSFSEDYDKNRKAADRSVTDAKTYIDEYQNGSLPSIETAPQQSASKNYRMTSIELAQTMEKNSENAPNGNVVIQVTGKAISKPDGKILYLEGTEYYPAVTLEYSGNTPDTEIGDTVKATCKKVVKGISGPQLSECF